MTVRLKPGTSLYEAQQAQKAATARRNDREARLRVAELATRLTLEGVGLGKGEGFATTAEAIQAFVDGTE
ncbi:hypothetical protein SEA_AGEOFDAPAGE_1 [Mycobacterium phage Ageofdapage]|nr:hypothetical protein SEA_AGEOFDAPAGE_1 [Mycobacterium phage Ageofdapage]